MQVEASIKHVCYLNRPTVFVMVCRLHFSKYPTTQYALAKL